MATLQLYGLIWDLGETEDAPREVVDNGREVLPRDYDCYDGEARTWDSFEWEERHLLRCLNSVPERPEPEDRALEREQLGRLRDIAYGSHLGRARRTFYRGYRGAFKRKR